MEKISKYKIIIPYKPDSFNQIYFGTRNEMSELKLRWEKRTITTLENLMLENELPRRFEGVAEFFFKLYFEYNRNQDIDNYFLIIKGIMDAFVTVGMLKDDTHHYALQNGLRVDYDNEKPRIEVYITHKYDDRKYINIAFEKEKINSTKTGARS